MKYFVTFTHCSFLLLNSGPFWIEGIENRIHEIYGLVHKHFIPGIDGALFWVRFEEIKPVIFGLFHKSSFILLNSALSQDLQTVTY
jgi:hypothetical protein